MLWDLPVVESIGRPGEVSGHQPGHQPERWPARLARRLARWLGTARPATAVWLTAVYAVFLLAGLILVHGDTVFGQDYRYHIDLTLRVLTDPASLFYFDTTNPPLLYATGTLFHFLFGDPGFVYATGTLFAVLNTAALHLIFLCGKRLVPDERVSALFVTFAAFLPVTLITSVVYAADGLTLPIFFGYIYALFRFVEAPADAAATRARWLTLAGGLAILGALAKFTFLAFAVVPVALLLPLWRFGLLRRGDWKAYLLTFFLIPALVLGAERMENAKYVVHGTSFPVMSGAMTLRSLLLPRLADLQLLKAPSVGEPMLVDGRQITVDPDGNPLDKDKGGVPGFPMLVNNRHSYPGLLHYSLYSDVLDLGEKGLLDGYGWGKRTAFNQILQALSVIAGLSFSLLLLAGMAGVLLRGARGLLLERHRPEHVHPLILLCCAMAVFLPVFLSLPFLSLPYYMGYWLPRLVFVGLIGFGLLAFAMAGRWLGELAWSRPRLAARLWRGWVGLVVLQALLGLGLMLTPNL